MLTYEQRLAEFAHGKRLLRLPRPVRDRADAYCDACGSNQPRTLYALKDLSRGRYHFVGDTCLTRLAKSGAVLKRYGRESGQKAYESEIAQRTQDLERGEVAAQEASTGETAPSTYQLLLGPRWRSCAVSKCRARSSRPTQGKSS